MFLPIFYLIMYHQILSEISRFQNFVSNKNYHHWTCYSSLYNSMFLLYLLKNNLYHNYIIIMDFALWIHIRMLIKQIRHMLECIGEVHLLNGCVSIYKLTNYICVTLFITGTFWRLYLVHDISFTHLMSLLIGRFIIHL